MMKSFTLTKLQLVRKKILKITNKNLCYMYIYIHTHMYTYLQIYIYRVSHELRSLLRESVPYVKLYRYNPKHLCPKLNGYGDNGKRKVWTS